LQSARKSKFKPPTPWIEFIPISINTFFVNYLFLSYLFRFRYYKLEKVPLLFYVYNIQAFMALFFGILFIHPIYNDINSQIISFFSYVTFSSILLIALPYNIKQIFDGLVFVTFLYSSFALFVFMTNPELTAIDWAFTKITMREYIPAWPQRFPQIIVLSSLYLISKNKLSNFEIVALSSCLGCITITFTRSIYLAFIIPLIPLLLIKIKKTLSIFITKRRFKIIWLIIPFFILYFVHLMLAEENTITYLISNSYSLGYGFVTGTGDINAVRGGSSSGERLFRWIEVTKLALNYPLFGTGFKGIYQFSTMGSTHSQYTDILLRVGIIGFFINMYLLYNVYKCYHINYSFITPIIISIVIFSIFNESIKLPFMGFLIFILNNKSVRMNSKHLL
jgi:hypothetical protein